MRPWHGHKKFLFLIHTSKCFHPNVNKYYPESEKSQDFANQTDFDSCGLSHFVHFITKDLNLKRIGVLSYKPREITCREKDSSLKVSFWSWNIYHIVCFYQELEESRIRTTTQIEEVDGRLEKEYEARLLEALRDIREQHEFDLQTVRSELETLYENKVIF